MLQATLTARTAVHAIIRDCPCVHVGFIDQDSLPQVVPMVAALDDGDDGLFLILHGTRP
jgi:nitroimidazol reductase NimA-like FMN-containing flavoprotein (pyridoxamine 5'-phosphate oxidase superfamily)